ncbi:hypothetical protein Gotur_009779 [Gossypium turneri]
MAEQAVKLRCQRIGCNATFTEDDNPEGSCSFHASPIFHDGMKEWSCCKKRSHDFSLFLEIPGCKTGKHTTEKPVLNKPVATKTIPTSSPAVTLSTSATSKESCPRCSQGFFCSDHGKRFTYCCVGIPFPDASSGLSEISRAKLSLGHVVQPWVKAFRQSLSVKLQFSPSTLELSNVILVGSQPKVPNPTPAVLAKSSADVKESSPPPKKIVDINQPQTCKNKGCGKVFKEIENHESACSYHPGPAVFHDRVRGWKCCDIYVKEFDEFMTIPPCKKGWHDADPVP